MSYSVESRQHTLDEWICFGWNSNTNVFQKAINRRKNNKKYYKFQLIVSVLNKFTCNFSYYYFFQPECTNVSFWYIPKRLRSMPHSPQKEKLLGEVIYTFLPHITKEIILINFTIFLLEVFKSNNMITICGVP